ncbi:MAG: excinuclease ABC subunit UvrC [Flavobacteriales bacterium]|jgi:excinuclease ABC subunit C|nr:excinuclease ABC subunit UvrC [Flavobacteriales bacterium]
MSKSTHITNIIKTLPSTPGVYQYFDKDGIVIYVGKAKSLKNRVSSYFNANAQHNAKTRILVKKIVTIKTIKVATEMDALLLENSLIKKFQPKYNIQLKDDKTYPWIRIKKEPFPRIEYVRRVEKGTGEYFGPFHSVTTVKTLLELFKNSFDIRSCTHKLTDENIGKREFKTSVEYYIGNCKGCCQGMVSHTEYKSRLNNVKSVLKGNTKTVVDELRAKMKAHAEKLEFETAAELKEKLLHIEKFQAKSTVVSATVKDVDVFNIDSDINTAYINYLKVINGAIIQSYTLEIKKKLDEDNIDLLAWGIVEIRNRFPSDTKEIIIPEPLPIELEDVKFTIPLKGAKKELSNLSFVNANATKLEKQKQQKNTDPEQNTLRILETIKRDLRLKEVPRHIECFDNSNFQGTNPVAACVVFKDAKPSKKDYRHFNIKTVVGPDDFASMEEVVYRRYKRLKDEQESLPQLIVIDGGKGQLSSAVKSLKTLDLLGKIAIVGIAKRLEEIYFPGDSLPIYIDKRSESLKTIQYLRNEAHRFGITHHRSKRRKGTVKSELLKIKGVGAKTQETLIRKFKSVKRIKAASLEDLTIMIGSAKAKIVYNALHKK